MGHLEKLRPLGAIEQFSSARHHLGIFNNVGVSVTYTKIAPHTILFKDIIFYALSAVIHRHQVLSCIVIDEESTTPHFARLLSIDLENTVQFFNRTTEFPDGGDRDVELDEMLQKQHNLNFKADSGNLPFWRLIITRQPMNEDVFVASFIFHHALGDGASGIAFHRHFHSALCSPFLSPLENRIFYPQPTALLPNLELLYPLNHPSPFKPPLEAGNLWTGATISLPCTTHFRTLTLSPSTTSLLIAACRAHSATLTATLSALLAASIFDLLPPTYTTISTIIPANIRHLLPPITHSEFGVFIDAFTHTFSRPLHPEIFWDVARQAKEAITAYIEGQPKTINISRLSSIPSIPEMFLSQIGAPRTSTFDVSNLGVVSRDIKALSQVSPTDTEGAGGKWGVGRTVFSRSAFAHGGAFSTGVVTGGDGCLVLGFAWQEGVVEQELIERVIGSVERDILGIVGSMHLRKRSMS